MFLLDADLANLASGGRCLVHKLVYAKLLFGESKQFGEYMNNCKYIKSDAISIHRCFNNGP